MQTIIPTEMSDLAKYQMENEDMLLERPNVVGVAIGSRFEKGVDTGEPCITTLVSTKFDKSFLSGDDIVEAELACSSVKGKIKNDVVEVGEFFAGNADTAVAERPTGLKEKKYELKEPPAAEFLEPGLAEVVTPFAAGISNTLKRRIRPVMGGFSVGHYKITAGTIGTCCYDLTAFPGIPGKYYILSNNHVLANSNNAHVGDPILQPGPFDGGDPIRDRVAYLSRYITIKFRTPTTTPINYVDAAVAEGDLQDLNREVYWGGHIKDLYTAPKVNDIVQKTGRTTGFTTGKVTNINATVDVNYGSGHVARFRNQIITTRMSAPGDSGSIIMNRDEHAVGLLFAGSNTRTIANNILLVQMLLKVRLHEK